MRALILLLALPASGCLAANAFHHGRTLPPGAFEVLGGPSGYAFEDRDGSGTGFGGSAGVRVGVVEGFDMGAQVSVAQVRVDAKVRLVDHEHLAVAVAPALFVGSLSVDGASSGTSLVGADLSAIASWTPIPALAITVFAGPGVGVLLERDSTSGWLARQGAGIRWWLSPAFALHPEVVTVVDAGRDFAFLEAVYGLGFVYAPGRARRVR